MKKISKKPKRTKTKKSKSTIPNVVKGIQDVEDLEENHVALFYGKSGRGKTETAASFPKPLLFLDINNEKGLKTVKNRPGVRVAKIGEWDDFIDLYWWLRDGQDYKTIVLDQITGLQDLCMREVRVKLRMSPDEPFQGFKRWGRLSGDMKTWLQSYRELSDIYNVVYIAHERAFGGEDETEDDEMDPAVGARLIPSLGSFVDGACDIIGHSFIRSIKVKDPETKKTGKKTEYCMRVGPHPIYVTKIRRPSELGPLPEYIVDPTYSKLVDLEQGKEIKSTQPKRKKRRKVNG